MDDELFKATNIFENITKEFKNGIELKTHKRRLKCYKNSFLASKGVDFLFSLLKKNEKFNNKIKKRNQAVSLMNIFLKWGIIIKIYPASNLNKFFDNKDIYVLEEKEEPVYECLDKSLDEKTKNFEESICSKNKQKINFQNPKESVTKKNVNRSEILNKPIEKNIKVNQLAKSTSCFINNSNKNSNFLNNHYVRQSLRKIQFNNEYKENLVSISPMNDINLDWSKIEAEGNNILKFLTKISLKKWPLKNNNSHNINYDKYLNQAYNNTLV